MSVIDSGKTFKGRKLGYFIEETGYTIYLDGQPWITQPDPFGKQYVPDGSYEDNALAQIEDLCNRPDPGPTEEEKLRADVDLLKSQTLGENAKKNAKLYYPKLWDIDRIVILVESGRLTETDYTEITGFVYPATE